MVLSLSSKISGLLTWRIILSAGHDILANVLGEEVLEQFGTQLLQAFRTPWDSLADADILCVFNARLRSMRPTGEYSVNLAYVIVSHSILQRVALLPIVQGAWYPLT